MRLLRHLRHEFWWWAEKRAGSCWQHFCPDDKVTYWLDWLPAFCTRHRYAAQNALAGR